MSASSEIRFKIGADTSALSRGFVQAQSIAAAAASQIKKKFDLREGFRSGVLALGLSIEKIAEKIAETFTGGAQESWKAALESAKEAERIIEESALRRMSTLRQIEQLEKEIARNRNKENAAPQNTGELPMPRKVLDAIGETMSGTASKFFNAIGAKSVGGFLGRASDIYRARGNEAGSGVETPADALKRSQAATADRLAKEAKIEELKEKRARDEARVDAAFLEYARLGMTEMEKALSIQDEMVKAEEKLADAKRKGKETTELELDAIHKKKALEEQLLKIEKDQTEEDRKKKRLREEFIEKYRRFLSAQVLAGNAQQSLSDARHDALAPSLEDLASGKLGTPTNRVKANRILQLEDRARRLFASGSTESAQQLHARALQMRGSLGILNTSDKNPFQAAEKQLEEANKHLAETVRLLTPTDAE